MPERSFGELKEREARLIGLEQDLADIRAHPQASYLMQAGTWMVGKLIRFDRVQISNEILARKDTPEASEYYMIQQWREATERKPTEAPDAVSWYDMTGDLSSFN